MHPCKLCRLETKRNQRLSISAHTVNGAESLSDKSMQNIINLVLKDASLLITWYSMMVAIQSFFAKHCVCALSLQNLQLKTRHLLMVATLIFRKKGLEQSTVFLPVLLLKTTPMLSQ